MQLKKQSKNYDNIAKITLLLYLYLLFDITHNLQVYNFLRQFVRAHNYRVLQLP
jgi:hypothetical protein